MNIKNIKNRADELLVNAKPQYLRILMIMLLIGMVQSFFSSENGFPMIVSLMVTIAFLSFDHGYIVSSLKIVRNNYTALKDEDAWVGFSRFQALFPTYLVMGLIKFAILFCITFVLFILLAIFYGATISYMPNLVFNTNNVETVVQFLTTYPIFLLQILIVAFIILFVSYILSIYFFAVAYLLEQYHMETITAIKESIQFIHGYAFDLFKLDLSYFGWFILIAIAEEFLTYCVGFIPFFGTLIVIVLCGMLSIYTFLPQYHLSRAIFFEEIAYRRYEVNHQQTNEIVDDSVEDFNEKGE